MEPIVIRVVRDCYPKAHIRVKGPIRSSTSSGVVLVREKPEQVEKVVIVSEGKIVARLGFK